MKSELFKQILESMKRQHTDWEAKLKDIYSKSSRLLFLDCRQLPKLINRLYDFFRNQIHEKLKAANNDEKKKLTELISSTLLPYVTVCFPDYPELSTKPIILDLILQCFTTVIEEFIIQNQGNAQQEDEAVIKERFTRVVIRFMETLNGLVEKNCQSAGPSHKPSPPEVVREKYPFRKQIFNNFFKIDYYFSIR